MDDVVKFTVNLFEKFLNFCTVSCKLFCLLIQWETLFQAFYMNFQKSILKKLTNLQLLQAQTRQEAQHK